MGIRNVHTAIKLKIHNSVHIGQGCFNVECVAGVIIIIIRKVLLRERKKNTARRLASTGCAALSPGGRSGDCPGQGGTYPGWCRTVKVMATRP